MKLVLFLTLLFGEGVFYYINYKILWLDSSKNVIVSKKLACFTNGHFITILREKLACPFRGLNSKVIIGGKLGSEKGLVRLPNLGHLPAQNGMASCHGALFPAAALAVTGTVTVALDL